MRKIRLKWNSVLLLFFAFALMFGAIKVGEKQTKHVSKATFSTGDLFYVNADQAQEYFTLPTTNNQAIILDIRTPEEYKDGHIKGAININVYDPLFKQKVSKLDTQRSLFMYCRSGRRTEIARNLISDIKFYRIYILKDGTNSWVERGFPLEK